MRILFLSSLYPPVTKGGGEISTHLIAQGLIMQGHDVLVATEGKMHEKKIINGVPVENFAVPLTAKPLFERAHARRVAANLEKAINWKSFDIIHAHDLRTAQIISELIADGIIQAKRSLVTARDYGQICGSPNNLMFNGTTCPGCEQLRSVIRNQAVVEAPLYRKPFRIWQYWHNIDYRLSSFRSFPRQIFISSAQRTEISRRQDLSKTQTHIIYNPVPPSYLNTPLQQGDQKILLYAGNLNSYKGTDILLEAFKEIAHDDKEIQLIMVGDGSSRYRYDQYVAQNGLNGQVRLYGHVAWADMMALYDSARIVVAPHVWVEPFGRTVAEAMARGKLVITSRSGGPAEMIIDNERGFLVKPNHVKDLTSKIRLALDLPQNRAVTIGQAAQTWAAGHLSVYKITHQHKNVYQEMLTKL